jgi:hypothetical protein
MENSLHSRTVFKNLERPVQLCVYCKMHNSAAGAKNNVG